MQSSTKRHSTEVPDDLANSPEIVELWNRYWARRDLASRNALFVAYEPLVRRTVGKLPARIRALAEDDDLCGFGAFGLIDAISKCDKRRDLSRFPAYAACRIRGTIIDELRRLDWVPRPIRRMLTDYRDSVDLLSNELGRTPRHSEIVELLQLDPKSSSHALRGAISSKSVQLPLFGDESAWEIQNGERAMMVDERSDPADHVVISEQIAHLHAAIARLTERQRAVIKQRFGAGQTQQQVAKALGVTSARICQIEATAIESLRRILREEDVNMLKQPA